MKARFWLLRDGTTRMRIKAETIEGARERAAELGLRDPESIVLLEDGEGAAALAREAGKALEAAYPCGYRSTDKEP